MCPQIACLRRGIVALITFVWLFSTVCFQMCSQIACPRRGKVTLVAFFYFSPLCIFKWPAREDAKSHWLHLFFSTVRVQMRPQNVYTRSCIITLIAFVWLISTVCSQMSPHMWGCKVTMVATIWLLSSVRFQMCPQIACQRIGIFIWPFPACVFKCLFKALA